MSVAICNQVELHEKVPEKLKNLAEKQSIILNYYLETFIKTFFVFHIFCKLLEAQFLTEIAFKNSHAFKPHNCTN